VTDLGCEARHMLSLALVWEEVQDVVLILAGKWAQEGDE
jgi:hypothetical protein